MAPYGEGSGLGDIGRNSLEEQERRQQEQTGGIRSEEPADYSALEQRLADAKAKTAALKKQLDALKSPPFPLPRNVHPGPEQWAVGEMNRLDTAAPAWDATRMDADRALQQQYLTALQQQASGDVSYARQQAGIDQAAMQAAALSRARSARGRYSPGLAAEGTYQRAAAQQNLAGPLALAQLQEQQKARQAYAAMLNGVQQQDLTRAGYEQQWRGAMDALRYKYAQMGLSDRDAQYAAANEWYTILAQGRQAEAQRDLLTEQQRLQQQAKDDADRNAAIGTGLSAAAIAAGIGLKFLG